MHRQIETYPEALATVGPRCFPARGFSVAFAYLRQSWLILIQRLTLLRCLWRTTLPKTT